jgi:hypothetical protein
MVLVKLLNSSQFRGLLAGKGFNGLFPFSRRRMHYYGSMSEIDSFMFCFALEVPHFIPQKEAIGAKRGQVLIL